MLFFASPAEIIPASPQARVRRTKPVVGFGSREYPNATTNALGSCFVAQYDEGLRVGNGRILVVDADAVVRSGICNFLADQGFVALGAGNCRDAQVEVLRSRPEALVLDAGFPDGQPAELIQWTTLLQPRIPVVVLAGQTGSGWAACELPGWVDRVLNKPIDVAELHAIILGLLSSSKREPSEPPVAAMRAADEMNPFVGSSAAIAELRNMAARVAASQTPVLIQGETGTGKGILAKWIHCNGARARRPFLDLNCAGLSRELLESELFGHQKGAFTSAVATKQGLLEVADGGTVFLDEIGDMDLQVQSKLLKVLEERVFRRVGDVRDRAVDMRLISASHRDLQKLVREQHFRGDLYFRVNIVWMQLPPLRQRREDILPLARTLLASISRQWGRPDVQIDPAAVAALERYSWPGNIRELRNVLERALVLADADVLRAEHLQFHSEQRVASFTPEHNYCTLKQMEEAYIRHTLERECGSIERAARALGIPRSSLYNKMKRFEIPHGTSRRWEATESAAAD
jgi:DNA-binding NtrC family response regulator